MITGPLSLGLCDALITYMLAYVRCCPQPFLVVCNVYPQVIVLVVVVSPLSIHFLLKHECVSRAKYKVRIYKKQST